MSKFDEPRSKFDDEPTLATFQKGTVAWLIQRMIEETAASAMKQLGPSHIHGLRALQRAAIGKKKGATLKRIDIIEHCKRRRSTPGPRIKKPVCAATVNQDITFLSGVLKYAGSAWEEYEDVTIASIVAARPFLIKHGLIGKSTPRKRRPTDEEIERLMEYFAKQDAHPRTTVKMVPVVAFGLASSRRRGEVCRITFGDVDFEKRVYWVRDLKHPTKKKGNDKSFVLWPELEAIIRRQPRLTNDPSERVFPYNPLSVGMRYVIAKKRLGIVNLRLHDNRREAISQWLKKLSPQDVRIAISGHETTIILERNYDGRDSLELVRDKIAGLTPAPTVSAPQ